MSSSPNIKISSRPLHPFLELPPILQTRILSHLSLDDLSQLARCVSYLSGVQEDKEVYKGWVLEVSCRAGCVLSLHLAVGAGKGKSSCAKYLLVRPLRT